MVEGEGEGEGEGAQERVERGGETASAGAAAADARGLGGPRDGARPRDDGQGAKGEEARKGGGPRGAERGPRARETPGRERDERERDGGPRGPESPVHPGNAADDAPLEAGAKHRPEPADREGGDGREGAEQGAVQDAQAWAEQHAGQHQRQPGRQHEIPVRRSAPRLPRESRRRDAGDGDEREREHRIHAANVRERLTPAQASP